ncbi:SubName: Full=Related to RAD57 protein {ECO:0000313/EMBL:CCA70042.1} [Serendipita indica DSM 11827]|nr:SubName: Full=Related to RAD57 protein {ECO:0000313/EMBL:CCA70042.1} [Serendipita indica DSM 11827]
MDVPIASLPGLASQHKHLFAKAGILFQPDVWLTAPSDIAKKVKLPIDDVQAAIDALCAATVMMPKLLGDIKEEPSFFTTGDDKLDKALRGGIRMGALTEIAGESASGKTQLALQLALMAQLPGAERGVDSGVAYFTTTSALPVRRLTELAKSHPLLRQKDAKSLTDNVHTCLTSTVPALISVLKHALSALIGQAEDSEKLRPIRVLILDSLGTLFHSMDKTTTVTLEYGHHHSKPSKRCLQYSDDVSPSHEQDTEAPPVLLYKDQSLHFNRMPLVTTREAMLGLVWANQLNTRMMLSRTKRRMRLSTKNGEATSNKRRKTTDADKSERFTRLAALWYLDEEEEDELDTSVTIRKLAVVFSATSAPCVMDFIVQSEGVQVTEVNNAIKATVTSVAREMAVQKDSSPKDAPLPLTPGSQDASATSRSFAEPQENDKGEEEFDVFDEAEWASYGEALGDLEEQWDTSEPDNQSSIPSDPEIDDDIVLESSDVEENLLL